MRTTIEIPVNLHQKLVTESVMQHKKGFSEIIVQALGRYFASSKTDRLDLVRSLKGSLSDKEHAEAKSNLKEGRKHWRT